MSRQHRPLGLLGSAGVLDSPSRSNNYSGAGVLVNLPSGGDALLLAESLSVPDFVGMMKGVENGELKAQGKVIDSITEDQEEYYGFDESDFPDPSSDGRVKMLLSYP